MSCRRSPTHWAWPVCAVAGHQMELRNPFLTILVRLWRLPPRLCDWEMRKWNQISSKEKANLSRLSGLAAIARRTERQEDVKRAGRANWFGTVILCLITEYSAGCNEPGWADAARETRETPPASTTERDSATDEWQLPTTGTLQPARGGLLDPADGLAWHGDHAYVQYRLLSAAVASLDKNYTFTHTLDLFASWQRQRQRTCRGNIPSSLHRVPVATVNTWSAWRHIIILSSSSFVFKNFGSKNIVKFKVNVRNEKVLLLFFALIVICWRTGSDKIYIMHCFFSIEIRL